MSDEVDAWVQARLLRKHPLWDRMAVTVPEGELEGLRVERFELDQNSLDNLRNLREGRGSRSGTYTRLMDLAENTFWMSDVDAEKMDHTEAVAVIQFLKAERVLINGLGLGMVLAAALSFDHVKHVDVVEKDERVIKLIGPHYTKDPRVVLHHADAWEQTKAWAPGTRWDVGWSDIWASPSTDALPAMARMNRSYGQRCRWHKCWVEGELRRRRRLEQREERRITEFMS